MAEKVTFLFDLNILVGILAEGDVVRLWLGRVELGSGDRFRISIFS